MGVEMEIGSSFTLTCFALPLPFFDEPGELSSRSPAWPSSYRSGVPFRETVGESARDVAPEKKCALSSAGVFAADLTPNGLSVGVRAGAKPENNPEEREARCFGLYFLRCSMVLRFLSSASNRSLNAVLWKEKAIDK